MEGLRKGAWSKVEDELLTDCVRQYGEGTWHLVPIRAGNYVQTFATSHFLYNMNKIYTSLIYHYHENRCDKMLLKLPAMKKYYG